MLEFKMSGGLALTSIQAAVTVFLCSYHSVSLI